MKGVKKLNVNEFKQISDKEAKELNESPWYPIIIDDDSLSYVITSKDEKNYFKCWLSTRFIILANLLDEDTNKKYLEIILKTGFGDEIVKVPTSYITRRELYRLTDYGFKFNENYTKELVNYFNLASSEAPCVTNYNRVGWFMQGTGEDVKYVFRTNTVLDDEKTIDLNNKYRYKGDTNFNKLVSTKNYLAELNELLTTSGSQLAIVAGLSSALVGLIGYESNIKTLLIHIFGDSSKGKSTFLRLALSCWGNPFKPPLANDWNGTENALYCILSGNLGVTVGFDEASGCNINFTNFIYNLNSGYDKARCNGDSSLKQSNQWRTTVISTAEESLIAKAKRNNGLQVRCLEFFNLYVTANATHSNSIYKFINKNYGILGERFVKYLYSYYYEDINDEFLRVRDDILSKINCKTNFTYRIADSYAILLLTAKYAKLIGVNIDLNCIEKILINHHENVIAEMNSEEFIIHKITEYVFNHIGRFPNSVIIFNKESYEGFQEDNCIFICEGIFEKILKEQGFTDTKVVVKRLYDKGFLAKNGDRYLFKRMFNK